MSTLPTIDSGTLGWVKSEIEDTASQARALLQLFESDAGDASSMRMCATYLHQIYGTLTMVELDGAARLVHESEQVAQKIADGEVGWDPAHGKALNRAIDDLSSYLEGLQSPPVPSPLQLVAPINRLREVLNAPAISELELFTPDLSIRPPDARHQEKIDAELFLKIADNLRACLERALLNALKNPDDRTALKEFSRIFTHLVSIDRRGSLRQLWWIGAGISEAMLDGALSFDNKIRTIFARINEQLKLLKDKSPAARRRAPPDELIKRSLLLIAYSNGRSPTVMEIKRSFALDEWIGSGFDEGLPDVEALSSALLRFNSEAEIDLGQVQSLLARYFSPQGGQVDVLDRLVSRLDSLQVAAERNELDILRRLVEALTDVVAAIREGKVRNLERGSMQMAGALLFIQDSGSGIRPGPGWIGQAEASISALREVIDNPGGDDDELVSQPAPLPSAVATDSVARAAAVEVRSELQYVEHALEQVANGDAPLSQLRGAEAHLKRIEGTLEILEQPAAAMLAEKLRIAVRGVVGAEPVQPRSLDALAMAVGTLGVCADELGNGATLERMESTIARAVSELAGIGVAMEAELQQVHLELVHPASHPGAEQSDAFDSGVSLDLELDFSATDADVPPPVEGYSTSLDIDDDDFEFDDDSLPPVASVESGDDELVDVFFQEANEIESLIRRDKERWRQNTDDKSALSDLRRGFHTLKGSGRFAEATSIAELSFIVEELLNRVMDGEQEPSAAIHGFIDRAHRTLAELIARRDVGDSVDLAAWQRDADVAAAGILAEEDDFSRDLGNELLDFQLPVSPTSTPAHAATGDGESPVGEVFLDELDGHITVIAESISEARSVFPHWKISDALLRTSHTLRGVFRSVGLLAAATMADALDDLLDFKKHGSHMLEEVDLVLVDQSGRLMRYASNKLGPRIEMSSDLALQFEELAAALRQRLSYLRENAPESMSQSADAELDDPVSAAPSTTRQSPAPRQAHGYGEEDELVEAFREEGQEIMARLGQDVDRWRSGVPASQVLSSMRRELHTFKGGARTVGWTQLGDLAHNTETLLENERLTESDSRRVSELVQEIHDLCMVVVASAPDLMNSDLERLNRRVLEFEAGGEPPKREAESRASSLDLETLSLEPTASTQDGALASIPSIMESSEARAVRVRTEVLDELVSYAGEVSILRARLQQQISTVKTNLGELGETVRVFRDQLRDLEIESEAQMLSTNERIRDEGGLSEFDPLELDRFSRLQTLSRQLGESLGSLVAVQAGISEFAGDADNTLQQQRHLSDSLQEGLLRTRMISFVTMVPRLRYLTRQTAGELGKLVNFEVEGEQVEVDRKVLDQMLASFDHMIRNALSHGIESAEEREAAGKPRTGVIRITLEQDGNDIVIRIADDGRGIDMDAIAARARSIGILKSGQELSEDNLLRVLAAPGLSTADEITQVSGRGVGMDVVIEMVRQLGGSIAVQTEPGRGTAFILRVPVTLAVSHALLVYAGEQMFAVPARLIVNVLRIKKVEIEAGDDDADAYTYYNDLRIPVLNLAERLGLPFRDSERDVANVIVVRAGLREIGLQVESISDTREVVVKPLGSLLQSIPGIGAVTLLGDGSIVLILNIPDLWQARSLDVTADRYATASAGSDNLTVMVVDDSMTVRNVMGRDLQNNGFEVILAKDGVDAVEQLRHMVPDIMLVDLEMPRMDGFELTRRVRNDTHLRDVPILVITSRAGTRHRDQALRLGANGYMSKPYRLDDLMRTIQTLTVAKTDALSSQADAMETIH